MIQDESVHLLRRSVMFLLVTLLVSMLSVVED